MKIAVITAYTTSIRWFRLDMIKEFKRRGCDVVVLGDEPVEEWRDFFDDIDVEYRQYYVSRNGTNPLNDLKTKRELKKHLTDIRPDKVFTYQAKPNIYGTLAAHELGIDEVYVMMGGLGSVFHFPGLKNKIVKTIVSSEYRAALRYAKVVYFQNEDDVRLFVDNHICEMGQVVMTKGSGVNICQFEEKALPDGVSFLFVGRLVRGKGVFEYLEAAKLVKASVPEAEFHLVGPFDTNPTSLQPEQLQSYVDSKVVVAHGSQKDVRPFLESCTCFVLPSYYGEGTPKSALEAMATGRPIIVADAVGSREVVQHGVNGYLVRPQDAKDLANAMIKIASDRTLSERMASSSRDMAVNVFDVNKVNSVICSAMGLE